MQTFLPYADFADSSAVLDSRRLGKQRVETFQILRALTWPDYAWKNHPAVRMWRGFVPALVAYGLANCAEWTRRGFSDSVRESLLAFCGTQPLNTRELREHGEMPPWLGRDDLHRSHQSALLRKDPGWYRPWFEVPDDLPYWWPPEVFPRWPVRVPGPVSLPDALHALGFTDARTGQAQTAAAAAARQDCLAVFRPGSGGHTAGLLAALRTPPPTLWIGPTVDASGRYCRAEALPDVAARAIAPGAIADPADGTAGANTARAPGLAAQLAMTAEHETGRWRFADPARAGQIGGCGDRPGLLVVQDAQKLSESDCARVAMARQELGFPPLLALIDRADAARRVHQAQALDLREPMHTGGGWDLDAVLDVRVVDRFSGRALRELVEAPSLVLTADRAGADRVTARLTRTGLRVATAVPGMRAERLRAAGVAWRARRLDALICTYELELTLLGRVAPARLLTVDAPSDPAAWRDHAAATGARRITVLVGPDAPSWTQEWARAECPDAWLLDQLGEPAADQREGLRSARRVGPGPVGGGAHR